MNVATLSLESSGSLIHILIQQSVDEASNLLMRLTPTSLAGIELIFKTAFARLPDEVRIPSMHMLDSLAERILLAVNAVDRGATSVDLELAPRDLAYFLYWSADVITSPPDGADAAALAMLQEAGRDCLLFAALAVFDLHELPGH